MNNPSPKRKKTFYKKLSYYASRFADSIKMRENSFVLTVAVFIGMIGGFGAVGIQFLIQEFQHFFWGGEFNLSTISNVSIIISKTSHRYRKGPLTTTSKLHYFNTSISGRIEISRHSHFNDLRKVN